MKSLSMANARDGLGALVKEIRQGGDPVEITHHGIPAAVLSGVDRYRPAKTTQMPGPGACWYFKPARTLQWEAVEVYPAGIEEAERRGWRRLYVEAGT